MIRKVGNKYVLYSRKKTKGKRRRLGTYGSRKAALKRERQVEYWKHHKGG